MESYTFTYSGEKNDRLDKVITDFISDDPDLEGISRSQIKLWIKDGAVKINGTPVQKAGFAVKPEDSISFLPQFVDDAKLEPYDFPLNIVHEDQDLLVIDKVHGISMHPGAGNRRETVVNALIARKRLNPDSFEDQERLGIVHRIDKDTSGLVVVAKNIIAHSKLAKQFSEHTVGRKYQALVLSTPRGKREIDRSEAGTVEAPIGRHAKKRVAMAVVEQGGKRAVTHWKVIQRMDYACLIEARLETGRTHQIRVHMNHIDSPVIGDKTYGNFNALPKELLRAADKFGRQALHACTLSFIHPRSRKELSFESALPDDFMELVRRFEGA